MKEPSLQPLIEKHGVSRVVDASLAVLNCPPTWQLSTNDLVKLSEFLSQ